MAGLRLGPLLRYIDGSSATIWVETHRPGAVEVRCADGSGGTAGTFRVADHHYALVHVTGLTPGTATPYEVFLDDTRVWPAAEDPFPSLPPSVIPIPGPDGQVRVAFGSCRWASPPTGEPDPVGPDALDALAKRIAADPDGERPDVLLLLGDQVYADETSDATREWLATRRDLDDPPGGQVADYEEYTHLYYESWLDPQVRWLLSTVPTCMIFDDHDLIDDWNTSAAWVADMRATSWWHKRVLSGLMSYWVYQHLGNLSPAELEADPLYASVREADDGTEALRAFAARAEEDAATVRWSYRRDFGRVRVVMVDSRAARVLEEGRRSMLDPAEADWVREQTLDERGSYDHLLIGTSLPWLLPNLVHDVEAWSSALCRGDRGTRWARLGEKLRRAADLEHWAAFPESFDALTDLVAEAGSGPDAPATVCVLSGDVHHAYVAEPTWPGSEGPRARVLQLTCSPVHNAIPAAMRFGFRFGWSGLARGLGGWIAGHGRSRRPGIDWRRTGGPWFGNQLMTLTLDGRAARLRLEQARAGRGAPARLQTVMETDLSR
ncbi:MULTISPECIES: alkaline phosphatase D family protein [unclassified Streptomyces]|uniref:alkaline phosphatase D family protein n=1 Tax=unclassified Streptomyces TaxID=2593676 RepID=UPI0007484271|nr:MULTISPECIES: alkaline phosphatase D family protein [unclassified Streptomyces]KUL75022.1 alkaline phosphatase [Streptomyces sp. NRRL WC-3605]KUL77363.1 alkaline phosphatase [Streptomyces sp. NRRL WC-3604]